MGRLTDGPRARGPDQAGLRGARRHPQAADRDPARRVGREEELAGGRLTRSPTVVIAGLDPAIHLLRKRNFSRSVMDPRVKPGGDSRDLLQHLAEALLDAAAFGLDVVVVDRMDLDGAERRTSSGPGTSTRAE